MIDHIIDNQKAVMSFCIAMKRHPRILYIMTLHILT